MANSPAKQASARRALMALSAQQTELIGLIEKLERHMTAVILSQPITPDPEVVETIQSLDLVRQSCGDTSRLLAVIAGCAEWGSSGPPSLAALEEAVDMERSLEGVLVEPDEEAESLPEASGTSRDIWI